MAQSSFTADDINFKGYLRGQGWCLCVGAGISKGMVPDWQQVTLRLLNKSFSASMTESEFEILRGQTSWTLDSWIQTALNNFLQNSKTLEDFNDLLEEILYEDLLNAASKQNLRTAISRSFSNPLNISKEEVIKLSQFYETLYPKCTNMILSSLLLDAHKKGRLPASILTFNADTILHCLFTVLQLRDFNKRGGVFRTPPQVFTRVYRSNYKSSEKIPIYHVHGCLLPPTKRRKDAREKLIFPEMSFAELSGAVFNWSPNTFLHYAQSHKIAFVGHSMSDPNIRRWLSWTVKAYKADLQQLSGVVTNPVMHVWFTTKPNDPQHVAMMEQSLWHLGTRICWLDNWDQLDKALRNLLAL